jgi:hypothetical protein
VVEVIPATPAEANAAETAGIFGLTVNFPMT